MSYCFNPQCSKPSNSDRTNFCQACGLRMRLGDRYAAHQLIGSGDGSSRTYLGMDTHTRINPRCIIKQFANSEGEEAFRQQAARLDKLGRHPQIPDLYAYFERERHQFLVQEFVEGRSLFQQLQQEGTFDEAQIRKVLREVLPVLHLLQEHQIIHRDVKPGNLIRRVGASSQSSSLSLVDFGAVKYATESALARTGTVIGSAEYAAPEQLMGKATFASDLYSLGVSCIHLLTGLRPFDLFDGAQGVWRWHSIAGAISADLVNILDCLLMENLSRRYSSADEVMKDLRMAIAIPATTSKTKSQPKSESWECIFTISAETEVNTLTVTPDGKFLIAGGNDGQIGLWDAETGESRWIFAGHDQIVTSVATTPDGKFIISGSLDGRIHLWDLYAGKLLKPLVAHKDGVTAIALGADGETLVSASRDKTLCFWNLATGQLLTTLAGHRKPIEAIALNLDRQLLASGSTDGSVKLWHTGTKELLRSLSGHQAQVSAIALPADGQTILSGSWDMTLKRRNLHAGGLIHQWSGHLLPISSLVLHPDGETFATGSHDQTIKLWSLNGGGAIATLSGHNGAVETLAFLPNGNLASGSRDETIRIWQLMT